jgi:serine protease Do
MRGKFEFIIYGIIILFFIVRYADVDKDQARRGGPVPPRGVPSAPKDPAVLLPDNALLPQQQESAVLVELDPTRHSGVGTAFAVDGKGTYVTARHVVDGCSNVYLVRSRGGLEAVASYKAQRNRDFAVIQAKGAKDFHLSLSSQVMQRGAEGFMMGYPQGNAADVRATVIGNTEMRSVGRYRMREPVIAWVERERKPGFGGSLGGISGGPVFDSSGAVVGTVVAGAPRRGRVYTTHPRVFGETRLLAASKRGRIPTLRDGIHAGNYHSIGKTLRASGAIRQVYCKVGRG